MSILAIDPGAKHTGLVECELLAGITVFKIGTIDTGECFRDLWDTLAFVNCDTVVIERFALYPHKARAQSWSTFRTVEVIGIVRLWCELNHKEFIEQTAVQKKAIKAVTLKEYELGPFKDNHQRDAAKHLVVYLKRLKREGKLREADSN